MHGTARLYARYALALLGLTLLAGVHMRAALVWPALRGGISGPNLVHAHSHAAFFGWAVMGACALVVARLRLTAVQEHAHRVLAHALGLGSAAAFVGFALRGYDTATIALSAFHVLLWVVFFVLVRRGLADLDEGVRPFFRAALLFLVVAGLATLAPVLMMVRGTADPWLQQLGVKLFLTPFVSGFLLLAAMGAVYGVVAPATRSPLVRVAVAYIACGVLPSTILYVSAAPPAAWLTWVGRGGIAFVAAGTLLFALDLLRGRSQAGGRRTLPALAGLIVIAAMLKAALELLAAAGVGADFMHNRAITIAVLHLVLLGVVTPAFALALRPRVRAPLLVATYGAGLGVMTLSVGLTGWPWAARLIALRGVPFDALFIAAAVAGGVSAIALLGLLLAPQVRARPAHPVPAEAQAVPVGPTTQHRGPPIRSA